MRLSCLMIVSVSFLAGGCMNRAKKDFDPMAKPSPAPEMRRLDRMVGSWSGTAEMVSPTAEEMRKMMPEGKEMPSSFKGASKAEWVMGGMFLKQEGWHEMGPGEKESFVEYIRWDPKAGKFRSWWFSDRGQTGEGVFDVSENGRTMHMKADGMDANGQASRGNGTIEFVDDKTMQWNWTEKGPMGKMTLKGTSRK